MAALPPGALLICADARALPATFTIPPAGQHPGPLLLCGTGWAAYPGSQWQEDPPGQWTVPVSALAPCAGRKAAPMTGEERESGPGRHPALATTPGPGTCPA